MVLSGGQAHESQYALRLLDVIGVQRKNGLMKRHGKAVLANKGYSSKQIRNRLKSNGIKVISSHKSNEKAISDRRTRFNSETYRRWNIVERSFGSLKENCRIATRYEKMARTYLSMMKLGCTRLFFMRLFN